MRRQICIVAFATLALAGTTAPVPPVAAAAVAASGSPQGWRSGHQVAELSPQGVVAGDRLGIAVATSANGSVLLVGSNGAHNFVGVVYVYTLESGSWTQTAELTASDGAAGDNF